MRPAQAELKQNTASSHASGRCRRAKIDVNDAPASCNPDIRREVHKTSACALKRTQRHARGVKSRRKSDPSQADRVKRRRQRPLARENSKRKEAEATIKN